MNRNRHVYSRFAALAILFSGLFGPLMAQQQLADRLAYYPRMLQLNHQPAGNGILLVSFDTGDAQAALYQSADQGRSWSMRSLVKDTTAKQHCCSGLWEVPKSLGTVAAGTLFWSPSSGCYRDPRCRAAITIQRSTDGGATWQPHSTLVTGQVGLWESEFILDREERLVAYYSTEEHRDEGFNQLLAHKTSTDGGLTWSAEVRDVAVPDLPGKKMRPGMAIVRRMPNNGKYVMIYEICGMGCDVFVRFSDDGVQWGNPTDPGTRIVSTTGHHFAHAPSFTITPKGRLLLVGQMLMDESQKPTTGNGTVLMYNDEGGSGPWHEFPAPVPVPEAKDNPCPNYSSQLLIVSNGNALLEVALKPTPAGCRPFVATSKLP